MQVPNFSIYIYIYVHIYIYTYVIHVGFQVCVVWWRSSSSSRFAADVSAHCFDRPSKAENKWLHKDFLSSYAVWIARSCAKLKKNAVSI